VTAIAFKWAERSWSSVPIWPLKAAGRRFVYRAGETSPDRRLPAGKGAPKSKARLHSAEVRKFVESGWNPLLPITEMTGETYAPVTKRLKAAGIAASEVAAARQAATGPMGGGEACLTKLARQPRARSQVADRPLAHHPSARRAVAPVHQRRAEPRERVGSGTLSRSVKENAGFAAVVGSAALAVVGGSAASVSFTSPRRSLGSRWPELPARSACCSTPDDSHGRLSLHLDSEQRQKYRTKRLPPGSQRS
jgi:hypothetical protein